MTHLIERQLLVLIVLLLPLCVLGWLAIHTVGGWTAIVVLAVPGLLWVPALCAWITGELRRHMP